jgi:hypothetical protein
VWGDSSCGFAEDAEGNCDAVIIARSVDGDVVGALDSDMEIAGLRRQVLERGECIRNDAWEYLIGE